MTTKHTPGPWSVVGNLSSDLPVKDGDGNTVACVPADLTEQDEETGHIREVMSDAGFANARLIASAPDLLVALQVVFRDHEGGLAAIQAGQRSGGLLSQSAERAVRAAIAKATGGEP